MFQSPVLFQTSYEMERYLKEQDPAIKPEPLDPLDLLDHASVLDNSWIKVRAGMPWKISSDFFINSYPVFSLIYSLYDRA